MEDRLLIYFNHFSEFAKELVSELKEAIREANQLSDGRIEALCAEIVKFLCNRQQTCT